jgi:diguanylate cyclase (GGDEF)-like protein
MALRLKDVLSSDQLPSLPAVAMKVVDLARQPEPEIKKLVSAIKSDPALAARILRTANSSLFGLRQQVTAIEQAVPLLGTMTVSSLVLGFSLAAQSIKPGPIAKHYQRVWCGSLIQAVAADKLCREFHLGIPAEFFVAGLLQDVGMLALLRTATDEYVAVLEHLNEQADKTIVQIERDRLGFTHAEVSSELCGRWKLAEPIRRGIAAHHATPGEIQQTDTAEARLAAALATASAIGDYFLREPRHAARAAVEGLMATHYHLEGEAVHEFLAQIDTHVREAANLFSFDVAEMPPYEEILARANAELADIALRAQLASIQAGAQVQAAQQELSEIAGQAEYFRNQACRDPLTGAYNRGFFEELLEREYSRCTRYGGSLGLIFLDLDHFKRLNDTYGHLFGDEVLKQTVQSIQGSVRDSDTVARFGGEEFVVLLLHLNEIDLNATAERIRESIESLELTCRNETVRITASLGTTLFQAPQSIPLNRAQLVMSADRAMYDAKQNGRNQVRYAACA